jgi:urease accessory protein UreF
VEAQRVEETKRPDKARLGRRSLGRLLRRLEQLTWPFWGWLWQALGKEGYQFGVVFGVQMGREGLPRREGAQSASEWADVRFSVGRDLGEVKCWCYGNRVLRIRR